MENIENALNKKLHPTYKQFREKLEPKLKKILNELAPTKSRLRRLMNNAIKNKNSLEWATMNDDQKVNDVIYIIMIKQYAQKRKKIQLEVNNNQEKINNLCSDYEGIIHKIGFLKRFFYIDDSRHFKLQQAYVKQDEIKEAYKLALQEKKQLKIKVKKFNNRMVEHLIGFRAKIFYRLKKYNLPYYEKRKDKTIKHYKPIKEELIQVSHHPDRLDWILDNEEKEEIETNFK